MSFRSNPGFVIATVSDIRFRAACVFGVLLGLVGLMVCVVLARQTKDQRTRLIETQILHSGELFRQPYGSGPFHLPDQETSKAAAVLRFANLHQGTRLLFDTGHEVFPLLRYETGPHDSISVVPTGSSELCIGAKCLAESMRTMNVVAQWNLPPLPASQTVSLHPSPSSLAAAQLIYISRPGGNPLSGLKVSFLPPYKKREQRSVQVECATYAQFPSPLTPFKIVGKDQYFYLPFASSQKSVRLAVQSEEFKEQNASFEVANAKITKRRGWPVIWTTKAADFTLPNGLRVHLPPQNLCAGRMDHVQKKSLLPSYEIGHPVSQNGYLPYGGAKAQIEFHIKTLLVDGVPTRSLGRATKPTDAVAMRMTATVTLSHSTLKSIDVPISKPTPKIVLDSDFEPRMLTFGRPPSR